MAAAGIGMRERVSRGNARALGLLFLAPRSVWFRGFAAGGARCPPFLPATPLRPVHFRSHLIGHENVAAPRPRIMRPHPLIPECHVMREESADGRVQILLPCCVIYTPGGERAVPRALLDRHSSVILLLHPLIV